ncbi:ATP-binding cassette domain-containing protein [Deferribacter autotrophicus]|nr:ATP-binding cassette domain-containing protein [Deferribacter autotrophicus]
MKLNELLEKYPYVKDIFDSYNLTLENLDITLDQFLESINEDELQEHGVTKNEILATINNLIEEIKEIEEEEAKFNVETLTILGGFDKSGQKEDVEITIKKGEIISVVGPTGSGKSRLLADIEWLAQGDTNTKRTILINGQKPSLDFRYSTDKKLVAQLSQNMNFVVDLTVREFITLHAESRMVLNTEKVVQLIYEKANELAGERFDFDVPITSLSGGQSRALMIADTAFLSKSPIVLIDEIENAGINRKKALEILVSNDKIVIMATHDPILALLADKRLVINNGKIAKIIETTKEEKEILPALEKIDQKLLSIRNKLRDGFVINEIYMEV